MKFARCQGREQVFQGERFIKANELDPHAPQVQFPPLRATTMARYASEACLGRLRSPPN